MKIQDVVIEDMAILLGIFSTDSFRYFSHKDVMTFGDFEQLTNIITTVDLACTRASQIIFILDDIQFPISPKHSYTCAELELICKNDEFFDKCVFVKGENVIEFDKNLVLN